MTTFSRWLPAVTQTPVIRKTALTAAGLAFVGGAVAGPVIAAQAAPTASPVTQSVTQDHGDKHNKGPSAKELNADYQAQPNFYYCGPASTRIALSADGHNLSQDDVAKKLGTTEAGTNSAEDTTRVLNQVVGGNTYKTTAISDNAAKPQQMDQLQANVKNAIDNNRAVVANIAGTATDTDGNTHSYEGGHYLAVTGYRDDGRQVKIEDPANPSDPSYWVSTINMANWIATRGYSS